MDGDQGKLFVGGISWETSEEKLKEYFGQYGEVTQANIMRDKITGKPRGFGFVHFSDASVVDRVLLDSHSLDGRSVEAKRAMSREDQQNTARSGNNNGARSGGSGGNVRTKKIFVGGLPASLTDEAFRQYFEGFGHVTDVVIMIDQNTQRPRGFGFVSFDSEDAVERVLESSFHDLDGKQVEVKRALPKDANPGMGARGNSGYGHNSVGNQNSYDSSNRYVQPQSAVSGFPPYGASGYGAAGYGYGAANNMGYGGYGAGYGAPSYGNPNVSAAGYGNGPTGYAPASQVPSGALGYGNQGYGSGYGDANGHGGYTNGAQMGYGGGYGQNRQV